MRTILIVGTGTIGKPLIRLALEMKNHMDVEEIIFHKNQPELKARGMLHTFHSRGAKLAVYQDKFKEFQELLAPDGFGPAYTFEEALERADVVIDCTSKGVGLSLRDRFYKTASGKVKGFIAQGSEAGFGKPFAYGINDRALVPGQDRMLQVVSCNTHQILCVLKTLAFDPENNGTLNFDNLVRARFYLARRAGDISQDESTIGVEVAPVGKSPYGSHQAQDALRVLATLTEQKMDIHSAADIYNNPFMHVIHFNLVLKERVTREEVERRFRNNPLTAVTYQRTNNQVFSEGRDRGAWGRIINQTVVCLPSLEVISDGQEIIGRCFTPQDGNALLSSLAATLWLDNPENYRQKVIELFYKQPFLFREV
jgi:glyceraldehyde-3-phosphate dehydrogenase/erythrose-4-phosphate dehydrogenase